MNKSRQIIIEKVAESVRNECNITDYGFFNIFEAVEKIGYRVIRYPIGIDSFLGIAILKDSDRIVFSNSSQILSREIFSIAHEIGHHKLHISVQEDTIVCYDDFSERDRKEAEANFFAACLLMPQDKVEKFIRYELNDRSADIWNGLDIARLQTSFSVSYDMALIRLKTLNILNESEIEKLKIEKVENTATKLLTAISGNSDLCKASDAKKVPAEYLEWVISNYNDKLIPKKALEAALSYVDLNADDFENPTEEIEEDNFDDLFRGMD